MAPIYSTQLANVRLVGPLTTTLYFVPTGSRVVLTDIDVFLGVTAAGQVSFVSIGHSLVLVLHSVGAGDVTQQWVGKQVLNPGDAIVFGFQSPQATIAITGYLLS